MSIKSENSHMSGLSGISTISCSSPKAVCVNSKSKGLDKSLGHLSKCEKSVVDVAKARLILDCLVSVVRGGSLSQELANKLEQILVWHRVEKYHRLTTESKHGNTKSGLLGIMSISKPELTLDERKVIKNLVEKHINIRTNKFIKKFQEANGSVRQVLEADKSRVQTDLRNLEEETISHWRDKLEDVCSEYQRDVLKCDELLSEWQKYKYTNMEELNLSKANDKYLESQIAEAQAKITNITCTIKMYRETPTTIDAFKKISRHLDDKITSIEKDIERKRVLKQQYEQFKNTEYDDILRRYLDLCLTIKKEERLLEML